MAGSSFAMEQYRVHLVWRLRSSFLNSSVIPGNPRESGGRPGILDFEGPLDSRVRGNDDSGPLNL